jgi:hypothetical protein
MKNASMLALTMVLAFTSLNGSAQTSAGRPLEAQLNGAEEVPGPGDPDGFGEVHMTLDPGRREICFQLSVSNIAPATAAHIHVGQAGVAGPVVVGLQPPTSGFSSACVAVSRELILEIIKNPSAYYVNVHNALFPAGAVRGQLTK